MSITVQTPLTLAATVTSAATLAMGQHTPVDATAGAVTVTLPTPDRAGARLRVEKVDASANAVTVSGTVWGGANTLTLSTQFQSVELFADTLTSWRPTADHRTKAALEAAFDPRGAAAGLALIFGA